MTNSKNPSIEWEVIYNSMGIFLVNKYDEIGDCIIKKNKYELHLQEIYTKLIQPEFVCIDAGANLGYHSVQFGKLCKKVYAFEPQPMIYNQLCANVLFNDLNQVVEPIKKGLGNIQEKKQLSLIEKEYRNAGDHELWNWGGRGIDENPKTIKESNQIQVTTLDSYNLKQCDFIKIDIQDYEFNAFKGATKLLTNYKPIIFLENHLNALSDNKAKEYLINLGYDFYRITYDDSKEWYHNEDCIAIHPKNLNYQNQIKTINEYFAQPKFGDNYYLSKEN